VALVYKAFQNYSGCINMFNNVARLDRTLLLHFPCSPDCLHSLLAGWKHYYIVSRIDKNYSKRYKEDLKRAAFVSPDFFINFNEFFPEYNKTITEYHHRNLIIKNKSIILLNNTTILIDGSEYKGKTFFFK